MSIRKIADRIDVSHMLLYSYFENRAAIPQALRDRGFEEMEAFCTELLRRAESGDALVEVRALLGRFIRMSHEHPMVYQMAWRRRWPFSIINGTLLLYHNVAVIGQTARARVEADVIEAAIAYLTK